MNNQTQHTKVLNRNRKYMYKAIIVLTRGFVIIIRVLIIRNIQMGVPLRVNQLVTFNSSTNPLVCTSEFGTWVWIWKGPSTFATNMDSMALEPCKINRVEPPLKNNNKKKKLFSTKKKPIKDFPYKMKYWKKTKKETIQDSYTIYTNIYVEKNENMKV